VIDVRIRDAGGVGDEATGTHWLSHDVARIATELRHGVTGSILTHGMIHHKTSVSE